MPRYALAGMSIVTDIVLPELVEVGGTDPTWAFELIRDRPAGDFEVFHEAATMDGRVWFEILRGEGSFVLRFPGVADFVVDPTRRRVSCLAEKGVGPSTLRHLLLDQVVPHVLAIDGSLVLHASAIATERGAVAFVGPSGFGKSSLAASFAGDGFALLADDFLLLTESATGFLAVPSYPGLRLWPDSVAFFAEGGSSLAPVSDRSEKQRLASPLGSGPFDPMPLLAVVVLGDGWPEHGADFSVHRMPARDGLIAVFGQAFRMERSGRDRLLAEFDRFARLAESTALLRLEYDRDYGVLPALRAEILDTLDLLV